MKPLLACLLLSILLLIFPPQSFAQQDIMITISPSQSPVESIDYTMPYPGLLPDNPLYILKTGRDQLIGFLISNPSKKAEFDLLQAEKRFQAGIMLYQKNKTQKDLTFATISKGLNYLEDAIAKEAEAKKQGFDIGGVGNRIVLSTKKQQQVLTELSQSHPQTRHTTDQLIQRLQKLEKSAEKNISSN